MNSFNVCKNFFECIQFMKENSRWGKKTWAASNERKMIDIRWMEMQFCIIPFICWYCHESSEQFDIAESQFSFKILVELKQEVIWGNHCDFPFDRTKSRPRINNFVNIENHFKNSKVINAHRKHISSINKSLQLVAIPNPKGHTLIYSAISDIIIFVINVVITLEIDYFSMETKLQGIFEMNYYNFWSSGGKSESEILTYWNKMARINKDLRKIGRIETSIRIILI